MDLRSKHIDAPPQHAAHFAPLDEPRNNFV